MRRHLASCVKPEAHPFPTAWNHIAHCLMLEKKLFRCYEAKIEESEKGRELNPGHLWLEPPVICHWAMATTNPHNPLYVLLVVLNSSVAHPAATIRNSLGVDPKILSIRCYEAKIEESEKGWQPPGVEPKVCDWGIQYHLFSTYRGLWGLVIVWLP